MTAQQLAAIILEEEPDHRFSRLLMIPPGGDPVKGSKMFLGSLERGPVRVMLAQVTGRQLSGEKAMEAFNDMLAEGYSVLFRNANGALVLYTKHRKLRLPKAVVDRMGKMGLHHGQLIKLSPQIKAKPDYKSVRAEEVIQAYTTKGRTSTAVELAGAENEREKKPTAHRPLSADEIEQLGGISNDAGLAYVP